MPRHNINADYHHQSHQFKDKYLTESFLEIKPTPAIIKTTGESIVREHRKSEMMRTGPQPYAFKSKPRKTPWYNTINWDVALAWGCSIALGFCVIYLAIFVFAPFILSLTIGQ